MRHLRGERKAHKEAGQKRPGDFAFLYPRPPLRDSTKEMLAKQTTKNQTLRQPSPSEGSAPISSEPAPSHRPWISARARPLADRLNLTTTRKRLARLVMFLNDPANTHFGHVDKWLDRLLPRAEPVHRCRAEPRARPQH